MISYNICLSLTYVTQYDNLQVHPCWCKQHQFIHFMIEQYSIVMIEQYSVVMIEQYSIVTIEQYSIVYILHLFIHSSVHRHLGCFHVVAVVNSTAVNTWLRVSFPATFFSRYTAKKGIVESCDNSSFLRNLHTVLHSGYTSLHSH